MKFTYTADDGTTFETAEECKLYERELSQSADRGWPSEFTPDKEKEWVATWIYPFPTTHPTTHSRDNLGPSAP